MLVRNPMKKQQRPVCETCDTTIEDISQAIQLVLPDKTLYFGSEDCLDIYFSTSKETLEGKESIIPLLKKQRYHAINPNTGEMVSGLDIFGVYNNIQKGQGEYVILTEDYNIALTIAEDIGNVRAVILQDRIDEDTPGETKPLEEFESELNDPAHSVDFQDAIDTMVELKYPLVSHKVNKGKLEVYFSELIKSLGIAPKKMNIYFNSDEESFTIEVDGKVIGIIPEGKIPEDDRKRQFIRSKLDDK
jgi:hypothetical protein